jgi:putative endonuclease
MAKGLKDKDVKDEKDIWHVYMVSCSDGTLYTGIAKDLPKRIEAHNSDKGGARYTRSRRPVKLVYSEQVESKSTASRLEYNIKRLPRLKKEKIIKRKG